MEKHFSSTVDKLDGLLYDLLVSYQDTTLNAGRTAECTQYYCNYTGNMKVFTIEDRSMEGRYKIHFDHNNAVSESEVDELLRTALAILRDGIGDDGRRLTELGL